LVIEREITAEGDIAQAVARATAEHQLDVGHAGLRIDLQALTGELPLEKAIARGLILNQSLGILVAPVVEHGTRLEPAGVGNAKGRQLAGRPFYANVDIAQANALTRFDFEYQKRRFAFLDTAANTRLVITQGLRRLVGLGLGNAPQTPQ